MASFGVDTRPAAAASGGGGGGAGAAGTGEGALSFLSRSLREDLRLIRARAGELETFLSAPVAEPELLARLRRAYSSSASSARTGLDLLRSGRPSRPSRGPREGASVGKPGGGGRRRPRRGSPCGWSRRSSGSSSRGCRGAIRQVPARAQGQAQLGKLLVDLGYSTVNLGTGALVHGGGSA